MIRADAIYLIKENPSAHGVFDAPTETRRMVYADIKSVGYAEFYRAKESGIEPTFIFVLSDFDEYENEKIVEYNSERFRVVRTYVKDAAIELTVAPATNDRG